MAQEYIAFISYRHMPLDTAVATKLHRLIERYTVPKELRPDGKKHLGRVFRDRDELPLSSDLTGELRSALDHSRFLIVVCSPDTPNSVWVDREIEYFLRSHDRDNVLAVLAAGTQEQAFPRRLTEIYGEDGVTVVEQVEPLAANISDQTNPAAFVDRFLGRHERALRRLRGEFLRLMAALLQCPYDTLRQRQRQYRQRQMIVAACAVAAVSLAFAGMLADRNRQIARQMALAQENESYALALLSASKLEDGDRIGALEDALAALPGGADDARPYRAEAERALADALYAYTPATTPGYSVYDVPLPLTLRAACTVRQETNITDVLLNKASTRLFLLDENGNLRCYETSSGRMLWCYDTPLSVLHMELPAERQGTLVCVTPQQALLLDVESGALQSAIPLQEDGALAPAQAAALAPDGLRLLTLHPLAGRSGYILAFRTLLDGALYARCRLPCELSEGAITPTILFSSDGSRWGVHVMDLTPGNGIIVLVNIFTGTVANGRLAASLGPYMTNDTVSCVFAPDNGLYVVQSGLSTLDVQRFAADSSQVQDAWTVELSQQMDFTLPQQEGWRPPILWTYLFYKTPHVLWSYEGQLVRFDGDTGELMTHLSLSGRAIAAMPAERGEYFYIFQEDGAIVRVDGSYAAHPDVQQTLGQTAALAAFGGQGSGALCYVPASDPTRAVVCKPLGDEGYTELDVPDGAEMVWSKGAYLLPDGRLLGLFYRRQEGTEQLVAARMDPAAAQTWQTWTLPMEYDYGAYNWGGYDRLTGVSSDGALLQFCDVVLDTRSGDTFRLPQADGARPVTSLPAAHRPSYSAWMDEGSGQLRYTCDMAAGDAVGPPQGYTLCAVLGAGANGWLAASLTPQQPEGEKQLGLYDLAQQRWLLPEAPAPADAGCVALAAEKPLAAALTADGVCCLIDLQTGGCDTIPLPGVPAGSVAELRFAPGDGLLLARQANGLLHILDLEKRQTVCTVHLEGFDDTLGLMDSQLAVQLKGEDRLYLGDSAGRMTGLCLDTASWQQTASIPRLLCYVPGSEELLCRNSSDMLQERLLLYPACTLAQLEDRARALLADEP